MELRSNSFPNGSEIPGDHALGIPDPAEHAKPGPNRNPHLAWSDVPEGTRSFALLCRDPDAPADSSDANQADRSIAHDVARTDFFHWVLVDIPAELREIQEGAVADGVTPRGKPTGATPFGRSGYNDYTAWFAGDAEMEGEYGGYDGPWPPFNDERLHHYRFELYALDTDRLDLPESFGGPDVLEAIEGKVLAEAVYVGTYSLNPSVRGG